MLADIATVDKALPRLEKEAKRDKSLMFKFETAKKVLAGLNEGHRVLTLGLSDEELAAIKDACLLTCKPMLYIANVDEDQLNAELPEIDGQIPVPICAKTEADLAELDPEDAKMFMEELGLFRKWPRSPYSQRLRPAWPAELLLRVAKPKRALGPFPWARKRRRLPASFTPTSSAASLRPKLRASKTMCLSVAKRAAATLASFARKARSTWCRTAMSCTLSSMYKTPGQTAKRGSVLLTGPLF